MSRPVLTLKKPVEPAPDKKSRALKAVSFLASLDLPLFMQMDKLGEFLPMAVGIRETMLARVAPPLHQRVRKALPHITQSMGYRNAVCAEGARRHNLDGSDAGAVSDEHRAHARGDR